MMQNPLPLEIERKYLIVCPDTEFLQHLPDCQATEMIQTYLIQNISGFVRRVRKRGTAHHWQYTYTQKKKIAFGEAIELEKEISESEYEALLQETAPDRYPIHKTRYCIAHEGQTLELDVYDFSQSIATLEIELPDIHTPVHLPEWVQLIADVTGKKGYSNFELSGSLVFPEL